MSIEYKKPTAEKIIIQFDDGTVKELTKGAALSFEPVPGNDRQTTIFCDMVQMSGKDLTLIVEGMIELGYKMGFFGGQEENTDALS